MIGRPTQTHTRRHPLFFGISALACGFVLACGDGGTGGASSLAEPGAPSTGDPSASALAPGDATAAQLCVDTINAYRAKVGQPPYARWDAEESCASDQAKSDSASSVAHGAFTKCGEHAQNECPGWGGPPETMITACLAAMWKEGPGGGHYDNMSSASSTKVACGFYVLPDGHVWAVQDFR